MPKRILIMGLSGAGKTTLAKLIVYQLKTKHTVEWLNADQVRSETNNWDFSDAGRIRQAHTLRSLADASNCDFVVVDFIAALQQQRDIFDADFVVWVDTVVSSKYADTDQAFEPPVKVDYCVQDRNADNVNAICQLIQSQLF